MGGFKCDTCGGDLKIYDGVVTWNKQDKELSNFKITHRNEGGRLCQPDNNVTRELYRVASVSGYMILVHYLLRHWQEGYQVDDFDGLQKSMAQLAMHINQKLAILLGE